MAELCPETAFSAGNSLAKAGLPRKPCKIESCEACVCNARCYMCPSGVAIAHLTFQFTLIEKTNVPPCAAEAECDILCATYEKPVLLLFEVLLCVPRARGLREHCRKAGPFTIKPRSDRVGFFDKENARHDNLQQGTDRQ